MMQSKALNRKINMEMGNSQLLYKRKAALDNLNRLINRLKKWYKYFFWLNHVYFSFEAYFATVL